MPPARVITRLRRLRRLLLRSGQYGRYIPFQHFTREPSKNIDDSRMDSGGMVLASGIHSGPRPEFAGMDYRGCRCHIADMPRAGKGMLRAPGLSGGMG